MKKRIRVALQLGVLMVGFYTIILGRPPATAQAVPVQSVLTQKDEDRDLAIDKLQEFRQNQENWNRETGSTLKDYGSSINRFWGGLAVIMLLVSGQIVIAFKTPKG